MAIEPQRFEESLLEYAFGDGDMDPAFLVDEAAADGARRQRVDDLIEEIRLLKRSTGKPVDGSVAIARLKVLAEEADRRRPAGVVDLVAARARRRGGIRWTGIGAGIALAAGLALFLWLRGPEAPVPEDEREAAPPAVADVMPALEAERALEIAQIVDEAGLGFAGPEALRSFARGWLAAVVIDLATPPEHLDHPTDESLKVADSVAARVFAGADGAPESAIEQRRLLLGGCDAWLDDAAAIEACGHGQFAYRLHRDLAVGRTGEAKVRVTSPEAGRFLDWVAASEEAGPEVKEIVSRLLKAQGPPTHAELTIWQRLVADPDAL